MQQEAARENWLERAFWSAVDSFRDFLSRDLAVAVLVFVALFKLADALAFSLSTNFMLGLGFSLTQVATIRNGIGFVATLLGGFTGGFIARALPLSLSLWIGGILQTLMILAFSWQAYLGMNATMLTLTTTIEFFADAVGTVIFVAYLSVLCKNPLYTATQFALLNALAALGRTVFSLGSGYIEHAPAGCGFSSLARSPACRLWACSPGCKSAAISTDYRRLSNDLRLSSRARRPAPGWRLRNVAQETLKKVFL